MLNQFATRNIWKTALLPVLDYSALIAAAGIGYAIRYKVFQDSFEGIKQIYGVQYLTVSLLISAIIVGVFALMGLYSISHKPRFIQSIINIIMGIWLVMLVIIAFLYFNEYDSLQINFNFSISRFIVGTYGIIASISVFIARFLLRLIEQILFSFGVGTYDVIIVGGSQDDEVQQKLSSYFFRMPFVHHTHHYKELNESIVSEIKQKLESGTCGEIYVLCNNHFDQYEAQLSTIAERNKVRFIFTPSGYSNFDLYHVTPLVIEKEYFFEMYYTAINGWNVVLKRIFDIVISGLFLVLFSWLILLIAIIIKLDSKGPVFYLSERVGPNGDVFKMFKFRRFKTQFNTSESDPNAKKALEYEQQLIKQQGQEADRGALYKIKKDPRMTRVGVFLEKTSLDEIPQFINVFIGNLSLVGPRAHQPREVRKYQDHHFKVLNIKPGITGYAQIMGRSDLAFEDEVAYDTYYVHNWSFFFDITILIQTPYILLFKRHTS